MYNLKQGVASLADLKDGSLFTMAAAGGKVIRVSKKGDGDYETVQAAVDAASSGDVILIDQAGAYGSNNAAAYSESVTMTNKDNISLVGIGPFASVRITAAAVTQSALTITGCRDINIVNLKLSGLTTGAGCYMDGTGDTRRIGFYRCQFTSGVDGYGVYSKCGTGQNAVIRFEDCIFSETGYGIFDQAVGGGNPTSQIIVQNCGFYYHTTWNIMVEDYGVNWNILNCWFGLEEDGTAPTGGFISHAATNSTGLVAGNFFSYATHEADVIALASEVLYAGNYTEAGVNTARPA